MSETNPKNYKKGDRLFICDRYADGKYQIGLVTIADVIERLTPKGNPKPPKYPARTVLLPSVTSKKAAMHPAVWPGTR